MAASSAGASTTGSRESSTVGPPGENEQEPAEPATTRTIAARTASATTMSRTVSAERDGLAGGAGSCSLLTGPSSQTPASGWGWSHQRVRRCESHRAAVRSERIGHPHRRRRPAQHGPAGARRPQMSTSGVEPGPLERRREAPDRNLAMELVRVTEAAAMAAGRWVGRGDKNGGDGAAVDAMRQLIGSVSMRGVVVIGEGEKDEAPMLFNGEEVGNGEGPWCDVAVDPIDGTTLMAKGMPGSVAVLAVSERDAMFDPSAVFYMEKIVTGPEAAGVIDIREPVAENIRRVAAAKHTDVNDVTVCVLDRPRHAELVKDIRRTGARIHFISDGDVAGAISAARPGTGIDLLYGIGGTPEGIIAAAAMKCMGGAMQGRLWPRDDEERAKAIAAGHDLDRVLDQDELVRGDNVFFCATGITDGELLKGVHYRAGGCTTQSIVMRSKSGTVRMIDGYHRLTKLREYSSVDFDLSDEQLAAEPPLP